MCSGKKIMFFMKSCFVERKKSCAVTSHEGFLSFVLEPLIVYSNNYWRKDLFIPYHWFMQKIGGGGVYSHLLSHFRPKWTIKENKFENSWLKFTTNTNNNNVPAGFEPLTYLWGVGVSSSAAYFIIYYFAKSFTFFFKLHHEWHA